jgi:LmbE family N-acetylglucosaminyl deacetylase
MRLPKLYDTGTLRRTAIGIGLVALGFVGFYAWQPWRFDFVERKPNAPLPKIPIQQTGLFERGKRIAIVTAHPDDEAFYLGGTLYKLQESGANTTLIVLTDGDKGYYPFHDAEATARTRRRETREVAWRVGIREVVFFGYPDGRLSYSEDEVRSLAAELQRVQPEIVLSGDPYYWPRRSHKDHRVASEITEQALEQTGFSGWALHFQTVAPNTFSDVDRTWGSAQDLLGVHRSQFFGERLAMIRNMVSENALEAGEKFQVGFAEPFRAMRYLGGRAEIPKAG